MDKTTINNGIPMSMSAPTISPSSEVNLSFAGCGFLGVYHAGVIAAIREYAPQLRFSHMSAASAGSIAAASLMCDVDVSKAISSFLKIIKEARSRALGALHPSFNLIDEVAKCLDATLPDNAHQICSGRLSISLTREKDHCNVVVSEFESKAELIQAISCSCFIPYYCGRKFPSYRGKRYFDGGWSDNQPLFDEDTVTISPFSGESDICPPDLDSANLFALSFAGTSIRFTSKNLYRLTVCLLPPSTEVCCRICRQGFEDALRFCIRNKLTTDARCLTILSNANIYVTDDRPLSKNSSVSVIKASSTSELPELSRMYTLKDGAISKKALAQLSSLFPEVLRKTIEEGDNDNTLLGYLFSFRLVRWFRTATVPFILPFEVLYLICRSITKWLEDKELDWWFAKRLKTMVDFLLKEIERQRGMYSARLTCQLAITEMDVTTFNKCKSSNGLESRCNCGDDFVLNIKPSIEAQREYAMLKRHDSYVFARKLNKTSSKALSNNMNPSTSNAGEKNNELRSLKEFAKDHKPLLSYSYTNDSNQVRVCEIYDVDRAKKQDSKDNFIAGSESEKCKFHIGESTSSVLDGHDSGPVVENIISETNSICDNKQGQECKPVAEKLSGFPDCL